MAYWDTCQLELESFWQR